MSLSPSAMPRNAPRRIGLLVPALLAVNAAAGAVVWHAVTVPFDVAAIAADAAGDRQSPTGDVASGPLGRGAPPAAIKLGETLARPLFRADRRPPSLPSEKVVIAPPEAAAETPADSRPPVEVAVEKPVEVAPPPPLPEGLRLVGVVSVSARRARALLRTTAAAGGTWMSAGETVAGWRIAEIGKDEVWLEAQGQRHLLSLDPRRAPRVAAPSSDVKARGLGHSPP